MFTECFGYGKIKYIITRDIRKWNAVIFKNEKRKNK